MRWSLIFCWICVSLCRITWTNGQPVGSGAGEIVAQSDYERTALEYERAAYYANNDTFIAKLLFKKALCYKQNFHFQETYNTLRRIDLRHASDSFYFAVRYETALAAFLIKEYNKAESEMMQLNYFIKDTSLKARSLYLYVLILNELHKYPEAQLFFKEYCHYFHPALNADSLYNETDSLLLLSPVKAKRLSLFFPGLGLLYCGKPIHGLMNTTLESTLIYACLYCFSGSLYVTGIMSLSLLVRTYFGGASYAARSAKQSNEKKYRDFNLKIKNLILYQY